MKPEITIVTASFNSGEMLRECINSISSQEVSVEHILIDGGSTDESCDVIAEYREHFAIVVSEPDDGIYQAMNKGLQHASCNIIGILNADDTYADCSVLKKVLHAFDDPTVMACYGDLVYIRADDNESIVRHWKSGDYKARKFHWGWMPPHPTFFVRRSIYEKYGLFDVNLGSAADYEIMLRFILRYSINVTYIPEILVRMRVGGVSNSSLSNRIRANRMDKKAWKTNGLTPYPWTLLFKPLRKISQWIVK